LVGSQLGLEVIEREYTVGPTRPGLDGLGLISQKNYWSTARSGGQNGLGAIHFLDLPKVAWLGIGGGLAAGLIGGFFLGRR
jgi:hypothetical protein